MKTERLKDPDDLETPRSPRAWLVRAGVASDPMVVPARYDLEGPPQVVLGRHEDGAEGADRITSDDRWMSRAHAAIAPGPEGWTITDLGSANGTLVGGRRTSAGPLRDGDVIETGSTFWVFRHAVVGAFLDGRRTDDLGTLSPDFALAIDRATKVARSRVPVMIMGETGTGKELIARHVHRESGREGPFVAINTAAVQHNLVASELFGVERGAHSMADRPRAGQIRTAQRGTLLLDEIGDMPLEVQVTLLRVLQESEVLPVGGDRPVPVDVRFICATHQNLEDLVTQGRFRSDLQARLQGMTVSIPPLRARREDIGLLIARFLRRCAAMTYTFSPTAYRSLMVFGWPLNVRQLERAIEAAVAVCEDDRIELAHLPEEMRLAQPSAERPVLEEEDRRRELLRLLSAHKGNVSAVARSMGYSRMQVHRWIKAYDVNPDDYR